MTENLLTTEEVAERLGVTSRQVRRLIEAGSLPAVRLGRDLFVKPEDLANYKPRPRGAGSHRSRSGQQPKKPKR